MDSFAPDTLLSWGFDSPKDLQNLLSNYGVTPGEVETEFSSAVISSQSFGVSTMTFKPGCANDVTSNDPGVLNDGIWSNGNQTQRTRTYKKVQKRSSVGRLIDKTCYRDYDELQRDLVRMFGIEGQLEDPQRTDWKLVYTDHENDILLVGDDPWDEFVTCVQSMKYSRPAWAVMFQLGIQLAVEQTAEMHVEVIMTIPLPHQSTCTFNPTLVASHQQKI